MPSGDPPPSPPGSGETLAEALDAPAERSPAPATMMVEGLEGGDNATLVDTLDDAAPEPRPPPQATPPSTQPPDPLATVDWEHGELPPQIGAYRVLRQLGEGGMGVVYEAEQERPRRKVALKVLRQTLASVAMRRRFEFEAEVLARLDHPGIARILEAGVEGPRSYFAMEYVAGAPIDVHLRRHPASVAERCTLIARIAEAVHHAHGRGVIHRDLKPGNVLVDANGQPKVLDFGIARVADESGRPASNQTRMGQIIGTPAYMSPEQTLGDSRGLDARSDVYALGILAWEVFAGRRLIVTDGVPIPELIRSIREDEAPWLGRVVPSLPRDLAIIVAKALEKEPARRYQSAAALADDLNRLLNDEPIAARPATASYQLRKFARRNRGLVLTSGLGLLALLAGFVASTGLWLRARTAESAALEARDEALATQAALRRRTDTLTLLQARSLIATDPTRALAYLHHLSPEAPIDDAWAVAWQALGAGVSLDVLAGHAGDVRAVAWGPQRRFVVTGAYDDAVRLWDLETGGARLLGVHDADIKALLVLPGSDGILAGDDSGEVRRYALDGTLKQAWYGLGDIEQLSRSGERIAVATETGVWRLHLGEVEAESISEQPAQALAWLGDQLVMAGEDGVLRLHNDVGTLLWRGHEGPIEDVAVFRRAVVSAGSDGTVRRWNGATSEVLWTHDHPLRDLTIGAGGLAAADRGGTVVWGDGTTTKRWRAHSGVVRTVTASDVWIATAGEDGAIGLWRPSDDSKRHLIGHEGRVRLLAWSGRGADAQLLSGAADGTARIWSPHQHPLVSLTVGEAPIESVAAQGASLAFGDQDGILWRQELGSWSATPVARGADEATAVAWIGTTPVAGLRDGTVLRDELLSLTVDKIDIAASGRQQAWFGDRAGGVWSVPLRGPPSRLGSHVGRVRAMAAGPGGLLTAGEDGSVLRWGAPGAPPVQIAKHDGEARVVGWAGIEPVACFDDGSCTTGPSGETQATALATRGTDIAVGDAAGVVRGWPGTHTGAVTSIAFTEQFPVSVGLDGRVVAHSTPPRSLDLASGALSHIVTAGDGQLVVVGSSSDVWFFPPNWPTSLEELYALTAEQSAVRVGDDDQLVGRIPPPALP